MKLLLLLFLLFLSACTPFGTGVIDSAGNAAKNAGVGVGAARVGKGIENFGKALIEKQKSKQKVTKKNTEKTKKIAQVITTIANEKDKVALAKMALLSNKKIELARERTKQVEAANSGYSNYAIGGALGGVFTIIMLTLFGIGRNTKLSIGAKDD